MPTGLLRNGAGDAGRKCTVPRNDDEAWLRRMLENIMAATVSFDPTLALERATTVLRFVSGLATAVASNAQILAHR